MSLHVKIDLLSVKNIQLYKDKIIFVENQGDWK